MYVSALDAFVLLEVYDILVTKAMKLDSSINVEPPISMKWLKPSKNQKRKARQRGDGKLKSPKKLVQTCLQFRSYTLFTVSFLEKLFYTYLTMYCEIIFGPKFLTGDCQACEAPSPKALIQRRFHHTGPITVLFHTLIL